MDNREINNYIRGSEKTLKTLNVCVEDWNDLNFRTIKLLFPAIIFYFD